MSAMEWGVLLGGVAGIAWVNWYFFLAEKPRAKQHDEQGGAEQ